MWCILHIDKICKKFEINNKLNTMPNWKQIKVNFCLSFNFRKYGTIV